jgi:hypothetical protein
MSASSPRTSLARIFFWPVFFFIEKVRFARSFLLIFLLIPDFYVAYLLWQQTTSSVVFSQKESVGVAYITPARAFLANVQALRVANAQPGAKGSGDQVRLMNEGDRLLAALDQVERKEGIELKTGDVFKQVRETWSAVKTALLTDPCLLYTSDAADDM